MKSFAPSKSAASNSNEFRWRNRRRVAENKPVAIQRTQDAANPSVFQTPKFGWVIVAACPVDIAFDVFDVAGKAGRAVDGGKRAVPIYLLRTWTG
ncbi:MAG: hypothetical protein E6H72_01825 [Betaproteobacteria bacterium]|nr:MAG: hypothetical protein E6H72_01825 [Betaproteobacteria bacterium]